MATKKRHVLDQGPHFPWSFQNIYTLTPKSACLTIRRVDCRRRQCMKKSDDGAEALYYLRTVAPIPAHLTIGNMQFDRVRGIRVAFCEAQMTVPSCASRVTINRFFPSFFSSPQQSQLSLYEDIMLSLSSVPLQSSSCIPTPPLSSFPSCHGPSLLPAQ